jgi:hypothetical protein
MPVVHTSRIRIEKPGGPHRTAHALGFAEPVHFGIHGGIRHLYQNKHGSPARESRPSRRPSRGKNKPSGRVREIEGSLLTVGQTGASMGQLTRNT